MSISSSPDGITYTPVSVTYAANGVGAVPSYGFNVLFTHPATVLPVGTNYLKVTLTAGTGWTPSHISLGNVKLTTYAPLTGKDIGSPAVVGASTFDGTTWNVSGGGAGIIGTSDQFHVMSQTFSGDGSITADITALSGGSIAAQAGVLFRDSLAANAMYVATDFEPDNGNGVIRFAWRSATGASANSTTYLFPTQTTSADVVLIRTGNTFTGYYSLDGTTWTQVGSVQNILINSSASAGLMLDSGLSTSLATAVFTGVHLNSGLIDTDIGSPAKVGAASAIDSNSIWTVTAGGTDIGSTSDQFNFASTAHAGDGKIVALLNSLNDPTVGINAVAKAGLMFRASTGATDNNATIFVTPGNGVEFQYRNGSGGSSNTAIAAITAPLSLELTRSGNSFSGFYSTDGINWIQVGSTVSVAMGSSAQAGLAVVSHDATSLVTAVFSGVSITGAPVTTTPTIMPDTVGTVSLSTNGKISANPPDVHSDRSVLIANSLTLASGSQLDLSGNDLIIHNTTAGNIASLLASGFANGASNGSTGIISSAAAANTSHLTTLGYLAGGNPFDNVTTTATDILLKYTYFGDATLDGKVDGSDYSRIDNGFVLKLTGWSNGDFNYDNVVNGSDYTLIDNAFNTQNAGVLASIAAPAVAPTNSIVPHLFDANDSKQKRIMNHKLLDDE